jgi:hypothetical protein
MLDKALMISVVSGAFLPNISSGFVQLLFAIILAFYVLLTGCKWLFGLTRLL